MSAASAQSRPSAAADRAVPTASQDKKPGKGTVGGARLAHSAKPQTVPHTPSTCPTVIACREVAQSLRNLSRCTLRAHEKAVASKTFAISVRPSPEPMSASDPLVTYLSARGIGRSLDLYLTLLSAVMLLTGLYATFAAGWSDGEGAIFMAKDLRMSTQAGQV